jgi:hypothetical protein
MLVYCRPQDWIEDDIRHQFSTRFFKQFRAALSDNAISDETWFFLLRYICRQIALTENDLRREETRLWTARAEELVRSMKFLQCMSPR